MTYLTKMIEDMMPTKFESIRTMEHIESVYKRCDLKGHTSLNCLIVPAFSEALHEHDNVLYTFPNHIRYT